MKRSTTKCENLKREQVLFDGTCGFCTTASKELATFDARHRLEFVPYQLSDLQARLPLSPTKQLDYMLFVDKNGRIYTGARAVFEAMKRLPGFWGAVGTVFSHPVLLAFSEVIYRVIARTRFSISRALRLKPFLEQGQRHQNE